MCRRWHGLERPRLVLPSLLYRSVVGVHSSVLFCAGDGTDSGSDDETGGSRRTRRSSRQGCGGSPQGMRRAASAGPKKVCFAGIRDFRSA